MGRMNELPYLGFHCLLSIKLLVHKNASDYSRQVLSCLSNLEARSVCVRSDMMLALVEIIPWEVLHFLPTRWPSTMQSAGKNVSRK